MRGCGFCSGLGRTSRGGTLQNLPSHENSPSSQIRGIMRSDSSHIARVSRGSMPMPVCSYGAERPVRSEEHTSELQSRLHLVCRLLLEKKNTPPSEHTTAP